MRGWVQRHADTVMVAATAVARAVGVFVIGTMVGYVLLYTNASTVYPWFSRPVVVIHRPVDDALNRAEQMSEALDQEIDALERQSRAAAGGAAISVADRAAMLSLHLQVENNRAAIASARATEIGTALGVFMNLYGAMVGVLAVLIGLWPLVKHLFPSPHDERASLRGAGSGAHEISGSAPASVGSAGEKVGDCSARVDSSQRGERALWTGRGADAAKASALGIVALEIIALALPFVTSVWLRGRWRRLQGSVAHPRGRQVGAGAPTVRPCAVPLGFARQRRRTWKSSR